jgi:hypothetical protein
VKIEKIAADTEWSDRLIQTDGETMKEIDSQEFNPKLETIRKKCTQLKNQTK